MTDINKYPGFAAAVRADPDRVKRASAAVPLLPDGSVDEDLVRSQYEAKARIGRPPSGIITRARSIRMPATLWATIATDADKAGDGSINSYLVRLAQEAHQAR